MKNRTLFGKMDWAWIAASLAAIWASFLLHTTSSGNICLAWAGGPVLPELCRFRSIFGIPCATCGLTRSFAAMAHLDIAAAFGWNRIGPLLFAAILLQLPYRLARIIAQKMERPLPRMPSRITAAVLIAFFCLLLTNWIFTISGI